MYYVLFIDHFSMHVWLFPIKTKNEVEYIFFQFKTVIEKILQNLYFYSNDGEDFIKFKLF